MPYYREGPASSDAHFDKVNWRKGAPIGYDDEAWREVAKGLLDIDRNLRFAGHVTARKTKK
jgi:hypothetical protein